MIDGLLNFAYAQNTGVAFSMLDEHGDAGRWGLSAIAFVAAALVLYFFWRTPRNDDRILGALALLHAGIVGNVTDRMRLGFVVDFIDVQFGSWHYRHLTLRTQRSVLVRYCCSSIWFGRKNQWSTKPKQVCPNRKCIQSYFA